MLYRSTLEFSHNFFRKHIWDAKELTYNYNFRILNEEFQNKFVVIEYLQGWS